MSLTLFLIASQGEAYALQIRVLRGRADRLLQTGTRGNRGPDRRGPRQGGGGEGENTDAVSLFDSHEAWSLREGDLVATGRFMRREDFYDGTSVRVRVDPETGEGDLVE